ncbi:hypothetical protein Aperf_G00000090386 [Anoplocephala perfoliata]
MSGYPPPAGFNFPPQQPAGYPPFNQGGYPPQPGYPPAGGPAGYPPQGPMGYPPPQGSGYPPQGPMGYPPPQGSGYPPQGPMGYPPPQGGQQGYPPQAQTGYPPSIGGYPGSGAPISYPGGAGSYPAASAPSYGAPGGSYNFAGSVPSHSGIGGISTYYSGRPTVVPAANFNPGQDAEDLRKAMRGLGTDEGRIVSILSKRSAEQRVEIAKKYMASFGKDLEAHLKSELSGKFEDLVLLSIASISEMLAITINQAVKGAGTDEQLLIQAIMPYSNQIIRGIPAAYQRRFGRDVIKDIQSDTSRDFEKILVAMLQGQREENINVDMSQAASDAEALYQAGEKRVGTEEAVFTRLLSQRSFDHIKAVNQCYQQKYGHGLEKTIKRETSGDYEDIMVYTVRFAMDKNDLLAEWFHKSLAGLGTEDWSLMQLTLGRSEIDLQDVKDTYHRKYGKSLVKAIENDTSGDYKRMLVALVGP